MSWLQQLIGRLKSVFGRESAQGEAALAPARTEPSDSGGAAVATEEKPAEAATGKPAAAEADSAAEVAAAEADEPVATPAATAEVAAAEAEVPGPEPAAPAPAEDAAEAAEPATASAPAESSAAADSASPASDAAAGPATASAATESPAAAGSAASPVSAAESADEPAKREASDPAISTLDVEGITAELQVEGPYGPGSGKPAAGGAAPSADFTVKGKESSKLFHTEKSPYFSRTKADVWFKSEADAESAGFQAWDHKKRAATKK